MSAVRKCDDYQMMKLFYHSLVDKKNIFYIYFTSDLLYWLDKSLELIPDSVNVVLIGAGLDDNEQVWVRNRAEHPFILLSQYHTDRDIWEYLFRLNKYNFGWIDVDCFVFEPNLFLEMTKLKQNESANCVWSDKKSGCDYEFLNTYFLFLNVNCIKKVKESKVYVSPHGYRDARVKDIRDLKSRTITSKQKKLLYRIIPKEIYLSSTEESSSSLLRFDTLQLYQVIADALGFHLNKIRNYCGEASAPSYLSNDAIHIGASVHVLDINFKNQCEVEKGKLLLQFAYHLLAQNISRLPERYKYRLKAFRYRLQSMGISSGSVESNLVHHLRENGINENIILRLMK